MGSFLHETYFRVDFQKADINDDVYFVPDYAKHRPACKCILRGEYYEKKTHLIIDYIMKFRPGSIVHAGTFFGDMLPSFSRKCTNVVYAFEPVLENYLLAKLCVSTNRLANVALFNAGLSDKLSLQKIATERSNGQHLGGSSSISEIGEIITTLTIDSLNLEELSIIQLDVEGHELSALEGAKSTIEHLHPIVMIEDNKRECYTFLEILNYIKVGKIPGLSIWCNKGDQSGILNILKFLSVEMDQHS